MNHFISVAIDGPAGAGKTTLARQAAQVLDFVYVDTGAIYRTVALYCCRKKAETEEEIVALLPDILLELDYTVDGVQRMRLNEEDVSELIRTPEISMWASRVSAIPAVRDFLLEQQRIFARTQNVIMDGRDIGTVVLPDATVKIFLTATPQARAQRRFDELRAKGMNVQFADVLNDVKERDYNDSHRTAAPLCRAEDAHLLDTTCLSLTESLDALLRIIREAIVS